MAEHLIHRIKSDHPLFNEVTAIRKKVFIKEQNISESEEWDAEDLRAIHLLVTADGRAAGTLRFFEEDGCLHVGRVAILCNFRSQGLGRMLMECAHEEGALLGFSRSVLDAQVSKAGFYRRLGYHETGAPFPQAGIEHIRMEKTL